MQRTGGGNYTRKLVSAGALLMLSAGCARVPVEVRTAMERQAAELRLIREKHRESVDLLFAQIHTLQLFILNDLEKLHQEKYARGPRVVRLEDNTEAVVYTDAEGRRLPPSYNPDTDVIAVSTSRIISEWFENKRKESEQKLQQARQEFMKLEAHIQIAQQINEAVTDYVDSLVNLRNKQKELGDTLIKKLSRIPAVGAVEATVLDLLKVDTRELESKLPKPVDPAR